MGIEVVVRCMSTPFGHGHRDIDFNFNLKFFERNKDIENSALYMYI